MSEREPRQIPDDPERNVPVEREVPMPPNLDEPLGEEEKGGIKKNLSLIDPDVLDAMVNNDLLSFDPDKAEIAEEILYEVDDSSSLGPQK